MVQMKTVEFAFEINWPLDGENLVVQRKQFKCLFPNAQIWILDIDETLNVTTTSNPPENDLTTTFLPSVEIQL